MSTRAPYLNRWQYSVQSGGVRPANNYGTSIAPGNNTYSAYSTLISGASVTQDCYEIIIQINSGATSAAARDILVTIGIDPAGGTTFTDYIPHLLGSCAAAHNIGGIYYRFPLFIPAGCSVGAKVSVNNATVGTVRVACKLFGLPTAPEMIRWGTYCDAFGASTGTSNGTAVTSGTASEGAWTSLGSESREHWWWQAGFGVNDSTMTALSYYMDLSFGDGSNKLIIFEDELIITASTEAVGKMPAWADGNRYAKSPGNATVYGRLQCSGTADASLSMIGYGVGG